VSTLTRERAALLFERRRKAWLASDAEAYLELWSDDMTIELPNRGEPIRGKPAYAELIRESMAHLRPIAWEFHALAVDGDRVLAEWTIEGEFTRTSRRVAWRGMSICRIADGRICEWREYWDPAALRR
jgi:ketosteroid isomerase-like protein